MAESIREVIERMKNNSQPSKKTEIPVPVKKPVKIEVPQEIEEEVEEEKLNDTDNDTDDGTDNGAEETPMDQRLAMEIEMLQNDGRFRVELLHQLQEINKALVVVAGVLVDLSGKNEKQ